MLDVDKMAEVLLAGTRAMIAKEIAPLQAENDALKARLTELEAREIPDPVLLEAEPLPDIAKMIADAVAAIPAPVIPDPIPGKDGLSISEVKQNADGELIVKMTNGETINAGRVRGADGVGFDDMAVEYDGERALTLRFEKGDDIREFAMDIPAIIDRGVWATGEYTKGDAVTWGGSLWIAQSPTSSKPGECKSWRLAVKKGRDAKPSVRAE